MKLHIDEEADALHLQLVESYMVELEEIAPGIIVDYGAEHQVISIEVLYLSKRPQPIDIKDFSFHTTAKKTNAAA